MINKKAFTLIELLVVIAIIALLLSILMPAVGMAKETARRVICATNLKSIGVGLYLYSQDHDGKMIPNAHYNGINNAHHKGGECVDGISPGYHSTLNPSIYWPYQGYIVGLNSSDPDFLKPLQMGKLFSMGYLEVPKIFYCPSTQFFPDVKDFDYYTEDLVKFMPPSKGYGWGSPLESSGKIRCRSNYMYWTWEETSITEVPNKPIVIDSFVTIAHKKGERPFGINALFGGGNVSLTTIAKNPLILEYVTRETFDERGKDYYGFVDALETLRP